MRISVDREACAGTGSCVFAAPGYFTQDDDDGRVVLLRDRPDAEAVAEVREAAEVCPVAAIRLTQDERAERS